MRQIFNLTKKELLDYLTSPLAYISAGLFLIIVNIWFAKDLFTDNIASARKIIEFIPVIFIIIIPAITMRTYSEEKRQGTLELLRTFPITKSQLLISKFFSSYIYILILLFLTFPIPLVLNILGNPDNGIILASYIGLAVISGAYVLIGQLISSATNNQIISFLISTVIIGLFFVFGENKFLEIIPDNFRMIFSGIGISSHFRSIAKGVIDTRDIAYFTTLIVIIYIFIYQNIKRISKNGT